MTLFFLILLTFQPEEGTLNIAAKTSAAAAASFIRRLCPVTVL